MEPRDRDSVVRVRGRGGAVRGAVPAASGTGGGADAERTRDGLSRNRFVSTGEAGTKMGDGMWEEDHEQVEQKWTRRLEKREPNLQMLKHLVMNYLVVEGYKGTVEKFVEESGISPDVEMDHLSERMAARAAVQNGNIQEAIERANELDPKILGDNPQLLFHLQQQKLIELIRETKITDALQFAQEELGPSGEKDPKFLAELERTLALLAFDDKEKCPVGELLDFLHRQKTASELNAAILSSRKEEQEAKLPGLLKLLLWTQSKLANTNSSFCEMDIRTGSLKEKKS